MPLVVLLLGVLALVALIPLSLVLRYRTGTSRRRARGWIATVNLAGIALSVTVFLVVAAFTNIWAPGVLAYTLAGLTIGCVLGALGLWLTRWDVVSRGLYYTPSRWLVLGLTIVIAGRLAYGWWRGWRAWQAPIEGTSWFDAAGVAGSMGAGAVVLGYYLVYWMGVRRRVTSYERESTTR